MTFDKMVFGRPVKTPFNLFREIFWRKQLFSTFIIMWIVSGIERSFFGRMVKTVFYVSSGPFRRKVYLFRNFILSKTFSQFRRNIFGPFLEGSGSVVKIVFFVFGGTCLREIGLLENVSRSSSILDSEGKTHSMCVKRVF